MKVLSLFDGISCGYEALLRAWVPVDEYYASEIDKHAIKVAMDNHPDIIQIGDVCQVKGEDYPNVDLVIGWSPCFVKWTKVWTYDWYKDISEVRVWDYVLWLNSEYNQVLKTWWESKEIWSIKWQWFLETLTTENHPYYVAKCKRVWHEWYREMQEPEWKKVKDIEVWDYVWLPIIHDSNNIKWITKQEARLLWRYMADWHTRKDFRKNRKWEKTDRRYYGVIYSIWDWKLDDFNHIIEYHITRHKHTQSTYRFIISSKRLVELCEDIWCWAINKSIPKWILDLPRELLIEFFKWYVSWDWYYKGEWVWRCSTISRDMAMSLCLLSATLFHTWAQIHYIKKPKTCVIQWRVVNQNDYYEVEIREYKKPQDHYMVTNNYIRFPVKEVKPLWYEDMVYNLEVEYTNSYTANNIVVHNCQGFSMAGKMLNFSDPRSKLFFEFVRLVKECKPKFFLLENVKMKKEYIEVITEQLWGVEPTLIDSALVSAQHRNRLYWVGKLQEDGTYAKVEIIQPEDEHVMLEDILEKEVDSKYILTPAQIEMIANWGWYEDPIASADKWVEKIGTLTTHCGKMSNGIKLIKWNWGYRKLTPVECERLQTLSDGYTSAAGDTQRYIQLGNGWTVSVIAHIFRNLFW